MACLNVSTENYGNALELLKTCEMVCSRNLGANHIRTAEIYMELGKLHLRSNKKLDSLKYIEKAFMVFEMENDIP